MTKIKNLCGLYSVENRRPNITERHQENNEHYSQLLLQYNKSVKINSIQVPFRFPTDM